MPVSILSNSFGATMFFPAGMNKSLKLLVMVVGVSPATAFAANSAMEWIHAMSEAMRNLNYRGNFVYMHQNQLESMSISHIRDESGERERLLSLNGEAREVIRDEKNLTCIWPASRKVVVDFSRKNSFSPIFIPENIDKIGELYDLELIGKDRIAGQYAVVVQIRPKDEFRYGLKFWINQENKLMMKSNLIDNQNRVIEQVMFTNLELFNDPGELVINSVPAIDENYTLVRFHSGENAGHVASDSNWKMREMPAGFRQESILKRHDATTNQYVHQMVYTDGLASLSIFIEKQTSELQQGETSMGAVNAFIRPLDDYVITAIGEVPALTVKTMAEAVFHGSVD